MTSSDPSGGPLPRAGDLASLGEVGVRLRRALDAGRISPSYLVEGVDGADARDAALRFASALLALGRDEEHAARVARRVAAGAHGDLHVLEKDKATVISVEALSATLEEAYRTPVEGRYQVFVIDPAEAMEPEGIARYLKILEEPPAGTVFLLVSTRPDRLPATVLSRVRRISLPPLPEQSIAKRLVAEGRDEEAARRLARWGGGSLARARRLADAGATEIVDRVLCAARGEAGVADVADQVLAAVAGSAAERRTDAPATTQRRQEIRAGLQDLLHALAIEARDRAAGRPSALPPGVYAEDATRLLVDLGRLDAAVAQNVTPAVVVIETIRRVRHAASA